MKGSYAIQNTELVIGLVGAVGTDMEAVTSLLTNSLGSVGYTAVPIHLINALRQIDRWSKLPDKPLDERYRTHMDAGDDFRALFESGDAMALLGIARIKKERFTIHGQTDTPAKNTAYILRSLKTPEEVKTLREVYGDSFVLVGAFSSKEKRRERLAARIAQDHAKPVNQGFEKLASDLIDRDEAGLQKTYGQQVREAFPLADFFLDADAGPERVAVNRTVELMFGNTFHTPSREEYGMFHAWCSSLRSASLARQVGAAICDKGGSILSLGCNDVPKAFGGLYWPDDDPDVRDHHRASKADSNDEMKRALLADLIDRMKAAGWFNKKSKAADTLTLLESALSDKSEMGIGSAEMMSITEYGRAVHAEMTALLDAAHRGVSVRGATLYCTTFPCHNCAKHIIASGIECVVYIEPYPKSRAFNLHGDAITTDSDSSIQVKFEPFVGVAPRKYFELFSLGDIQRKEGGKVKAWTPQTAAPRLRESPFAYLRNEQKALNFFEQMLNRHQLNPVPDGGSK